MLSCFDFIRESTTLAMGAAPAACVHMRRGHRRRARDKAPPGRLPHAHSDLPGRGNNDADQPVPAARPRALHRCRQTRSAGHRRHRLHRRRHDHCHRPPSGQGPYHRRRTVGLGHRRPCLRRRLRRVRGLRDRSHTLCRDRADKVRIQVRQKQQALHTVYRIHKARHHPDRARDDERALAQGLEP